MKKYAYKVCYAEDYSKPVADPDRVYLGLFSAEVVEETDKAIYFNYGIAQFGSWMPKQDWDATPEAAVQRWKNEIEKELTESERKVQELRDMLQKPIVGFTEIGGK